MPRLPRALSWFTTMLLLALSPVLVLAQAVAGRDYQVLETPQPVVAGSKIEVLEFFYYGCPFCYEAEDSIRPWLRRLPDDVVFRRVPAQLKPQWESLAKTYFTLEALGQVERLHRPVFDTIHLDGLALSQENVMADYAARNGIDRDQWLAAYRSPETQQKLARTKAMEPKYQVGRVPTYIVDGKYMTTHVMAGGHEESLRVIDDLIVKARRERRK